MADHFWIWVNFVAEMKIPEVNFWKFEKCTIFVSLNVKNE
jgi:hypothetical protein